MSPLILSIPYHAQKLLEFIAHTHKQFTRTKENWEERKERHPLAKQQSVVHSLSPSSLSLVRHKLTVNLVTDPDLQSQQRTWHSSPLNAEGPSLDLWLLGHLLPLGVWSLSAFLAIFTHTIAVLIGRRSHYLTFGFRDSLTWSLGEFQGVSWCMAIPFSTVAEWGIHWELVADVQVESERYF